MIDIIRQIISDINPLINTKVGSAIYYLVVVPSAAIYDYISGLIEEVKGLITDKKTILDNFKIPQLVGSPGIGKLTLTLSPTVSYYSFPEGTTFKNENGDTLISTELITTQDITCDIPVETSTNTDTIFNIGDYFSCSLYGSLIENCVVSQQITGGVSDETLTEYEERIEQYLTQTTTTAKGIYNKIKEEFPTLLDLKVIKNNIYIKSPLQKKKTTTNNYIIRDNISYVITSVTGYTTYNKGLYNEYSVFEEEKEIEYLCPYLVKDIYAYIQETDEFPIGFPLYVSHADSIMITGTLYGDFSSSKILDYITKHSIGTFKMSDFILNSGATTFTLPITLYFNGKEVTDKYNYESAYYTLGLTIKD